MMRAVHQRLSLLLLGAALAGCQDDPGSCGSAVCLFKQRTAVSVETTLSAESVVAGQTVDVGCVVHFDDDTTEEVAPPDVQVSVTPEDAGLQGAQLSPTKAGTYTVQCVVPDAESTPAKLEVTPGEPARSMTVLDPSTIRSGEVSRASCMIADRYDNPIEGVAGDLEVTPPEGVTVSQLEITGQVAGEYEVACTTTDPNLERVPATLTVTPGAPQDLQITVTPVEAAAGTHVDVVCEATDAAGNPLTEGVTFDVTPEPMSRDASGFTPTVAGEYDVTCSVASAGLVSDTVVVTVVPGPAATIEILMVDPTLPIYAQGAVVTVTARVTDAYGNETTSDWTLDSNPTDATRYVDVHQVELTGNGSVELIATATSDPQVEDRVIVTVDGDTPVVVINTPERGEIIQGSPGQSITVSGQVTDPTSGVASLTIEGMPVTVNADGSFSTTISSRWGINIFEGLAIDDAGNERMFGQSFELASSYRRARNTRIVSGRIQNGLMVRLSQAALDDNTPSADDLATIARLAIQQADIESLIPDPVTTFNSDCSIPFVTITGALRLHVDNVSFGTPDIDITAINGGLHLRAEIPNLSVTMHTSGDVCDIGIGVSGTAYAQRAVIQGDIQVSSQSGGIVVSMPTPSVSLTGFGINMNLPSVIDWAVDGIISLFSGAIRNRVQDALADVIHDEVPPVVDDFLSSLTFGTSVQLPSPISLSLGINTRLGSASFAPGGGNIGFATTIYSSGAITPEPIGGILQESVTPAALSGRGELVVGLSYDLLNQALYSIWYGGGLDLDLTDFAGGGQQVVDVTASGSAMLPPVISPSGNSSYPIELAIGDLEMNLDLQGVQGLPPIAATIYASAVARARVSVNSSGELVFELAPNPEVVLDFATPLENTIDLPSLVSELETLLQQLIPELFNEAIQGVPIPTLDLSSLAGSVLPSGIELGLGNPQTEVQSSYLVLGGYVRQLP